MTDKPDSEPVEPWEFILQKLGYTSQVSFQVSAEDIKRCGKECKRSTSQFEPRLLAYQITSTSRPPIFQKLGLYILPIKNGVYLLLKTPIYQSLDYTNTNSIQIKKNTDSMILRVGDSETSLLDNLRYSGVFERPEYLGEPILYGPLLNGRHRCSLTTKLGEQTISIQGVQYEVDSCYESKNAVLLIEAKSGGTVFDSFNIRQLYFPYREILKTVGDKKKVIPVFLHHHKGLIHIWRFDFQDPQRMDSISLVHHTVFQFSK